MRHSLHPLQSSRAGRAGIALALSVAFAAVPAAAQAATVGLGEADAYAVLANQSVSNTGPTVLTGNLGLSPGNASSITGEPVVHGETHAADGPALQAQVALTTAYNDAAGRSPTETLLGPNRDLVDRTLVPGVYASATELSLSGTVTLDALGDPNAVFVFQAGTTLVTGSGSRVALQGGAQACNVFWQVGSSATLGTATDFTGTIMADQSVTLNTGARIAGRALARNASVTLDSNTVTRSACAAPTSPTPTPSTPGTPGTSGGAPVAGAAPQAPPASRSRLPTRNGRATLRRTPGSPGSPATPGSPRTPGSPACTDGFRATVRGRKIDRVVFRLDGRRIASRSESPFRVSVDAAAGRHNVTARVTFRDATRAKTLSLGYRACAAASLQPRPGPSRFTG